MKFELSETSYLTFSRFIQDKIGMVLSGNKQYLVRGRLSSIAQSRNYTCINAFLNDLIKEKDPALTERCIELMTTNETYWFRDNYPYKLLESTILPAINKRQNKLRIWSSACASGQEPYSIAMSLLEYKQSNPGAFARGVNVTGTDISTTMLEHCNYAHYDSLALARGLSPERKKQFFEVGDNGMLKVKDEVKSLVNFRQMNLLNSYSLIGKFDIVFCRNVLIYFSAELKAQIISQIHGTLNPGGYLFLGASESLSGFSDSFSMLRCNPGIVYQKK